MSEYKGIKGFQVQTRTEDPAPFAQALADNPYAGSWSSGGSLNQARNNLSGFGTQTSSLAVGGNNGGSYYGNAESYNGTAFTEVADLNQARRNTGSAGADNTAGITFGGIHPSLPSDSALNESWNGSAWTEVGDLTTARQLITGTGTQTAALGIAGGPNPGQTKVESWDGSSWTEIADVNTARNAGAASGLQPAALFFGGYTTTDVANTEVWNGSSWTEVSDLNTARGYLGGSDNTSTSALAFGGSIPPGRTANTESWDGSSWTEVNDLATARNSIGGTGANSTSALAFGGYNGSTGVSNTEEWSFSGIQPTDAANYADAITGDFYYNSTTGQFKNVGAGVGSWSSGGNLNGGRYGIMGAGSLTAGLAMGGTFQPSDTTKNTAETYDGTSWSNAPTMPGNLRNGGSWGVQTSAVAVGGSTSPGATPLGSTAFEFDGSSFSNGGSLNTARRFNTAAGASSTAGITWGGGDPGDYAITESYDGSSWTEVNDLNQARGNMAGNGTQTAAIAAGGGPSGPSNVELWDGTNWTETTELNTGREFGGPSAGMGSSTAAIVASGSPNNVESWDGTSWTEVADLGTGRPSGHMVGYASTTSGMLFGGTPNSYATYTEEWDQPSFQIKTVTTS